MHDMQYHGGVRAEYRMEVLRTYKSAFERQTNEPMRITIFQKSKHVININNKSEWNSQQIERLRAVHVGGDITNNDTNPLI